MNNEPVAIRYDFDGYGYQYMDSGSGSDWQTRVEGEFLYTHPASLVDWSYKQGYQVGKEISFQNALNKEMKGKDLTDEEITQCLGNFPKYNNEWYEEHFLMFARAILRKVQENG